MTVSFGDWQPGVPQELYSSGERGYAHGSQILEVADVAGIRQLSLSILDKSFAVTYALAAVAMLIGLFGLR